jgi:hypothetical protein
MWWAFCVSSFGFIIKRKKYVMNDLNKFFATSTGRAAFAIIFLVIAFFGGMEYKSYQIRSVITDTLAPAVMNSLDSARTQADDAKVKGNISSLRAQGILSSPDGGNTYTGLCSNPDFVKILNEAESAGAGSAVCNVSTDNTAWAVAVPLKSDSSTYACSDSTGHAITINNPLGKSIVCQ